MELSQIGPLGLSTFLEWIRAKRDQGAIEGPWLLTTATPVISKALLRIIDPRLVTSSLSLQTWSHQVAI